MSKNTKTRSGNLREDCVTEALSIIAHEGLDKLSLREVARRLGVSHQAPYKHYLSRDHLLAEVVKRAYEQFSDYLQKRLSKADSKTYLRAMGEAYIRYAFVNPLEYRLMFNTVLPDPAQHPDMMKSAHRAFDMLRNALRLRLANRRKTSPGYPDTIDHEALFIWSTLHGLVSIMRSDLAAGLRIGASKRAVGEVLDRLGRAID